MSGTGPLTRSRALSTNLAAIMGDVTPTSEVEALRSELADLKRQLAALTTKTPELSSSDKPKAPKFDAPPVWTGVDRRSLIPWIESVTRWLRFYGLLDDASAVTRVVALLAGPAFQWYLWRQKALSWTGDASQEVYQTWGEMQAAMEAHFRPAYSATTALLDLEKVSQTGSLSAYVDAFMAAANEVHGYPDDFFVQRFLDGLQPSIRTVIAHPRPVDMLAAMSAAQQYQQSTRTVSKAPPKASPGEEKSGKGAAGSKPGVTCFWCGNRGHTERQCNQKKRGVARSVPAKTPQGN